MGYLFSLSWFSKSATETALYIAELGIVVSGAILTFGAVGEYLEDHHKLPRWMEWPKLVFIILVVLGLIGEFFGDGAVFVFSEHLQSINEAEAKALRMRVNAEISARLELEKQFLWEGPRDVLVRSSEGAFKKNLGKFAGQKFKVSMCDPAIVPGQRIESGLSESNLALQAMRFALSGAGWKLTAWPGFVAGELPYIINGCSGPGILVGIGNAAPQSTRDAACALQETINEVLTQKVPSGLTTCWSRTFALVKRPDALPEDEIDVEVGPHPAVQGDPWKTVP
jgi:hypothetical protein